MTMNRILKISILFFYVFFTQVYPVVHWHAQEHDEDVELRLSVHPPEILLHDSIHDDHHDKADEHEHEDIHFEGDFDYTFQSKTIVSTTLFKSLNVSEVLYFKPSQPLSRAPIHTPLKIPSQYLSITIPNRAPPFIS